MARNVNVHWRQHEASNSTTASARTGTGSARSYETAPSECSDRPPRHVSSDGDGDGDGDGYFDLPAGAVRPAPPARASVDTYASTSDEELRDDADLDGAPAYAVPTYGGTALDTQAQALPTTPRDFADLFPTAKRISIRHDDATVDGNMNLRVDTHVEERPHRTQSYTLFHLRMHDLRDREFSLRRYCRDSGREVCHSRRKYQDAPAAKPPVLQRASSALASLVHPHHHHHDARPPTAAGLGLTRADSGYDEVRRDDAADDDDDPRPSPAKGRARLPTNTIKLEFSNYAHIDVKRRGAGSSKRYAFEYWGHTYSWRRVVQREHDGESVTFYLVRADDDKQALAHISPVRLTPEQAREEAARGGWVPPCYMRITDDAMLNPETDISDVVVATGLLALVDDCIKRRFHAKQTTQLHIPLLRNASFKLNMEYVGPKRLIDDVFHRASRNGPPRRRPTA